MRAISKTSLICTREPGFRFERATVWQGAAFLFSLAIGAGLHCRPRHRTAANAWTSATCRKEPQCPFSSGLRGDTTGLTGGKSDPKIAFQNKGLMNVIYDVLETKSDIDWF